MELNDEPQCWKCGAQINAMDLACPNCGYVLVPHHARVNCKRCGHRVSADAEECPWCGKNPRANGIGTIARNVVLFGIAGLLVLCCGWITLRVATVAILGNPKGLPPSPPTVVIHVIEVIASPTPLPPTLTPLPSITKAPSAVRGTAVRTATTALSYSAVALLAPLDRTIFSGGDAEIVLQWQAATSTGLRDNEWYEIQLTFANRNGTIDERASVSKDTHWQVPSDVYRDIALTERTLNWSVRIVRAANANPLSGNRTPIGATSANRTFIWQ